MEGVAVTFNRLMVTFLEESEKTSFCPVPVNPEFPSTGSDFPNSPVKLL